MWKLVGYRYREVCNAMESMCAATNTISFKAFTDGRHVLIADDMCLPRPRPTIAFSPRALSRATISQAGRLPSLCRPLASLNCVFYKNTFRGLGPSRKRADRRHEAWLSCSGGRVARNILTAQPTRLPLQLFQFFVYLGEGVNGEFQVFPRMRGGDLRANARGAMWNNRIKETDHVNTFLQHARSELL